jgi:phosphoserine phosphatase
MRTAVSTIGILACAAILASQIPVLPAAAQADPLPSWNEGPGRQAIVDFVQAATDKTGPNYVAPEERIAVFDQDGTTWVEQPVYPQLAFAFDQAGTMASKDPILAAAEPFKTVLSGDRAAIGKLSRKELERIVTVTHTGMTVESFQATVREWIGKANHPRWNRPYTDLVYQPMLEAMRYLRENGFRTYIVTGGGQDFVRVFSERVYGIPPEQVVGSAVDTKFGYDRDGKATLTKAPRVILVDDKAGKPTGIHMMIGRRPVAAFGNSAGDRQMLEYVRAGGGARLMMLVLHDDAKREYAYGPAKGLPDSKVGAFPQALYDEAKKKGWTVISVKNDWKSVFAFDPR